MGGHKFGGTGECDCSTSVALRQAAMGGGTFWVVLRLARANMTLVSAVTYLAGAVLGARGLVSTIPFFAGWLFVLLTQFMTHFLGEVADAPSDALNRYSSPITGGSGVLRHKLATPQLANRMGYLCAILAAIVLRFLVPSPARNVGMAIMIMAWAYSAIPVKLNHRCLGEIDATIVTNLLLPYFAAAVQRSVSGEFPWMEPRLSILVIPPMFAKFSLFMLLNMADRRPDWASGKITLAVLLGDRISARVHAACMCMAYLSAVLIAIRERNFLVLAFMLPSAPYGWRISRALLSNVPYRLNPLLVPALFHSTLLVWGVLVYVILTSPVHSLQIYHLVALALASFSFSKVLKNRLKQKRDSEQEQKLMDNAHVSIALYSDVRSRTNASGFDSNRCETSETVGEPDCGLSDRLSNSDQGQSSNPLLGKHTCAHIESAVVESTENMEESTASVDVVVVGAGVGGLVAAASLIQFGLDVTVLEKRPSKRVAETGADLALWPGAITILKKLGVPESFFATHCFSLDKVYMCNMDFPNADEEASGSVSANVLKTIDMVAATERTGERFVLVARKPLMDALRDLVPDSKIVYGATVTDVSETEETESVIVSYNILTESPSVQEKVLQKSITGRVAIGADGARSIMRDHIAPSTVGNHIRFCGEVCYRGVLDCGGDSSDKITRLFPDEPDDHVMRINYGAGLRSSFGFMSADGKSAYWWVKETMPEAPAHRGKMTNCNWPEPLRTLHDITPEDAFYVHPIEDSASLSRWSSNRVALVGDSAHVVTPNMGQGACLATEDSFVLTCLLAKYWSQPDGHVEAFYQYEMCRKPYAEAVAKESRMQLFLGQFRSWPLVFLRELALRLVPDSVLQKKLKQNNFPVDSYMDIFENHAKNAGAES